MTYHNLLKQHYNSWQELERQIELLDTTTEKGNVFEQFCYAYFLIKKERYKVKEIYDNGNFPEKYRTKYSLESSDHGVDGLIITEDDQAIAYQCKFRNGRAKPTYDELAKFWLEGAHCEYRCVFANCATITTQADKQENTFSILAGDLDNLDPLFFENLHLLTNATQSSCEKKRYTRRPYQTTIIETVKDCFSREDRGKLIAACGTGKTLTALWIVEDIGSSSILFLTPSIALVKQTLEVWSDQAKEPFDYLCVCSDSTVARSSGDDSYVDISVNDLGAPVTTDPSEISSFLRKKTQRKKIIFSTYQSADKISEASLSSNFTFDMMLCDEAHRTAGKESSFNIALSDYYIPAKKRLFMTATERLVSRKLLQSADENGTIIFSMDDEGKYGPTFYRYGFDNAIADGTISDYKIIIAGIKENDVYNFIQENTNLQLEGLEDHSRQEQAQSLYVKILLAKAMRQYGINKVISFHSSIARAEYFVSENNTTVPLKNILHSIYPEIMANEPMIDNISSKLSARDRSNILNKFRMKETAILSNAKCLTEGVDVPAIDCVYFVDKKKSLVEIVQACGRALRKKPGVAKTAYFIVPILVPENSADGAFNQDEFQRIYDIIQSLRCQDSRLEDWIEALNEKYVRGQPLNRDDSDPVIFDAQTMNLDEFGQQLYIQIASEENIIKSSNRPSTTSTSRTTSQKRTLKTIFDYNCSSAMPKVDDTIAKFTLSNSNRLPKTDLKIDHNNVANTERLGLIKKELNTYALTELGQAYANKQIKQEDLLQRQIVLYNMIMEDNRVFYFPYRTFMKVFLGIQGRKSVSSLEYMLCLYTMANDSSESIERAVSNIRLLRLEYPNLLHINQSNQVTILNELNEKFGTTLSELDIWGKKATTVKNQFYYLRDHLCQLSSLFEKDRVGNIVLQDGKQNELTSLLNQTRNIETLSQANFITYYTSVVDLHS